MKTSSGYLALFSACAALGIASPSAHGQESRFYVEAEVGGTVTHDTSLKEFFGPVASGSKVSFDPGIRTAFIGGYRVTDWFSAEGEIGAMVANIDSITGASRVDAVFSSVPFLVNARFHCPIEHCISPYFGFGLGGSASAIDVDDIDFGVISVDGYESTVVFAYQAFAGVRFRINERMGLSVAYHFFATTDSNWDASGPGSDEVRFGGTQTHAASFVFDFRF